MPSGLLLLSRFFLRVDDVLFRIFDTRIFIDFHPGQAPALAGVPTPAQIPGATRAPTAMPTPAPAGTAALDEGLGRLQLGTPRGKASTAGASAVAAVGAPTAASGKASAPRVVREVSGCEASYAEVKAVSVCRSATSCPPTHLICRSHITALASMEAQRLGTVDGSQLGGCNASQSLVHARLERRSFRHFQHSTRSVRSTGLYASLSCCTSTRRARGCANHWRAGRGTMGGRRRSVQCRCH